MYVVTTTVTTTLPATSYQHNTTRVAQYSVHCVQCQCTTKEIDHPLLLLHFYSISRLTIPTAGLWSFVSPSLPCLTQPTPLTFSSFSSPLPPFQPSLNIRNANLWRSTRICRSLYAYDGCSLFHSSNCAPFNSVGGRNHGRKHKYSAPFTSVAEGEGNNILSFSVNVHS